MNCGYAHDFIYKGVATLDSEGSKCRLRQARDVARVILAQAQGWKRRYDAVKSELALKGFFAPFDKLKLESHLLIDDYVNSMIVVWLVNFYVKNYNLFNLFYSDIEQKTRY